MSHAASTVIISGGSKGLGQGFVDDLLKHDFRVATFSRSKTDFIENTLSRYPDSQFIWEPIDATDIEGVTQFVNHTYKHFGGFDALINNVGVGLDGVLALMKDKDIDTVLSLNLDNHHVHIGKYKIFSHSNVWTC